MGKEKVMLYIPLKKRKWNLVTVHIEHLCEIVSNIALERMISNPVETICLLVRYIRSSIILKEMEHWTSKCFLDYSLEKMSTNLRQLIPKGYFLPRIPRLSFWEYRTGATIETVSPTLSPMLINWLMPRGQVSTQNSDSTLANKACKGKLMLA